MQIELKKRSWLVRASYVMLLCLLARATTVFGQMNFDITLYSLTNHNTSAYSNYTENTYGANFGDTTWLDTNGDTLAINPALVDESLNPITPGHVSHVDVHTLIPSRPDLRWFANGTCWFGEGSHINIGVNNNTTSYVASMISDLEARGFNGLIFSWYGMGDQTDDVAQKVKAYLASSSNTNKIFHYIIMVVFPDFQGGESLTNLVANINYCKTNYFSDPNYETEPVTNGNPILMFFGVRGGAYLNEGDMEVAKDETTPNGVWVDEYDGHITEPWVNQTYQWTDNYDQGTTSGYSTDPFNLSAVTNEYPTIVANPTKQAFGAMCAHFDGTLTKELSWSLGKYLPSSNGLCEVERAAEINSVIPTNMTRMQWATWSDWEEGTEVESGSENYFALTPQVNNGVLSWTITSGYEQTVDHYEVYASTDGVNAALLCSVPTGIYQTNLSQFGLASGSYQLYVDAIGKPCIRNHLSAAAAYVTYTTPVVVLDLQPLYQLVPPGNPVSFSVTAEGQAPLSYQWTLNGQGITGATNSSYSFNALAGTNYYAVAITNSLGSTNSSTAEVVGATNTGMLPFAANSYFSAQITFSGYTNGAGLVDFPVLVRLSPTNVPGFSYSQFVSPNTGADLRFTSAGGAELPFEIDQWNPSGQSEVWVQVPSLTGTNNYINAYWGNPADSVLPPSNTNGATWSNSGGTNNFLLVYHLSQSTFPYADSTLQYPALAGTAPAPVNGIVGTGQLFTGGSDFLDAGDVNLGNTFTLSVWVNLSPSESNIQGVWANGGGGYDTSEVALFINDYYPQSGVTSATDGALLCGTGDGTSGDQPETAMGLVTSNQWHLVTAALNRTAGTIQFYVDGAAAPLSSFGSSGIKTDFPTNQDMNLGRFVGGSFPFTGIMDEARIQSGLESSNWVWASYMTVAANASFETYAVVVPPAVTLGIQSSGGNIVLTWPSGTLQLAPAVTGPYTNVTGASNPYTLAPSGAQQFFRVKVQ